MVHHGFLFATRLSLCHSGLISTPSIQQLLHHVHRHCWVLAQPGWISETFAHWSMTLLSRMGQEPATTLSFQHSGSKASKLDAANRSPESETSQISWLRMQPPPTSYRFDRLSQWAPGAASLMSKLVQSLSVEAALAAQKYSSISESDRTFIATKISKAMSHTLTTTLSSMKPLGSACCDSAVTGNRTGHHGDAAEELAHLRHVAG